MPCGVGIGGGGGGVTPPPLLFFLVRGPRGFCPSCPHPRAARTHRNPGRAPPPRPHRDAVRRRHRGGERGAHARSLPLIIGQATLRLVPVVPHPRAVATSRQPRAARPPGPPHGILE